MTVLAKYKTDETISTSMERLVAECHAASDPLRISILRVLKSESFGVTELCSIFEVAQSGMSHHLKVLLNADLVATKKEGNSIFYRRAAHSELNPPEKFKPVLYSTIDELKLPKRTLKLVEKIHCQRAELSQSFFAKNAEKFQQKQALIAEYSQYKDTLIELLDRLNFPPLASVIEIGPGEGELLVQLASRFKHVYAFDSSAKMLKKAKANLGDTRDVRVQFFQGDPRAAVKEGLTVDLLVLNMVMHHISSPSSVFEDAYKLLNPGGALLITELCNHDQPWAKENCGDVWMGFDPQDLMMWAKNALMLEDHSVYLGMKNGFQIQIRVFRKGPKERSRKNR